MESLLIYVFSCVCSKNEIIDRCVDSSLFHRVRLRFIFSAVSLLARCVHVRQRSVLSYGAGPTPYGQETTYSSKYMPGFGLTPLDR